MCERKRRSECLWWLLPPPFFRSLLVSRDALPLPPASHPIGCSSAALSSSRAARSSSKRLKGGAERGVPGSGRGGAKTSPGELKEGGPAKKQTWEGLCSEDILVDERTRQCALLLGATARGERVKTGGNQGVLFDAHVLRKE